MRLILAVSIMCVGMITSVNALASGGAWGKSVHGAEYCYPADSNGDVIRNSQPIPDYVCGGTSDFGRATTGGYACFPAKRLGDVLVGRQTVAQYKCERYGYKWGRSGSGGTYCYPKNKDGRVLPGLQAVDQSKCY